MTDLSGSPSSAEILFSHNWKKTVLELCNMLHEIREELLSYYIMVLLKLFFWPIFVFLCSTIELLRPWSG